jgi:CHAT domain-containing protein
VPLTCRKPKLSHSRVDEATLVLSAPAEGTADLENDGLLTASEISKLPIDAEWVVLSACNSASGERSNDDALSGLAQAFLYAGANSLLVSHWRLRDDTAAQLTVDTFRNVSAGMAKAEALRQAQLKLMADKSVPNSSHPAAWAPFILVGQ